MRKKEALDAMKKGNKVTHRLFLPNEHMTMKGVYVVTEDGTKTHKFDFWKDRQGVEWQTGYSLVEDDINE